MDIKQTLEFDKVINILKGYAKTPVGILKIESIELSNDLQVIKNLLLEVEEALLAIIKQGDIGMSDVVDISSYLNLAQIGGILATENIWDIQKLLFAVNETLEYWETLDTPIVNYKHLHKYINQLSPIKQLRNEINNTLDNGEMLDTASDELFRLRKHRKRMELKIRNKINELASSNKSMLSEGIVSVRGDRYVLPVKQEYKNKVKGIIHDQSASGNTVFIEPSEIVLLSNELQLVISDEKKEVARILMRLSGYIANFSDELEHNLELIGDLDVIFTKARYAKATNAIMPKVNDKGIVKLKSARHPLINKDEVVANDIYLGEDYSTLLITGPNTGGKTVVLKTAGLLSLMVKAGMLLPVLADSEIAVFDNVFVDIGDEQSIEQSLSTFSSHMTKIINIVDNLTLNSLVLLDELGAGTDPKEGVALAYAILEHLRVKHAKVIITSHYSELKTYAYNEPAVMNANVEFDKNTLKPTYRLLIGTSGSSHALYVSERLGLEKSILKTAKDYTANYETSISETIAKLEYEREVLENERANLNGELTRYQNLIDEYNKKINDFEKDKESSLEKAKKEAKEIVEEAKVIADTTIEELKRLKKEGINAIKQHEINKATGDLKTAYNKNKQQPKKVKKNVKLQAGDRVYLTHLNVYADLVETKKQGVWQVMVGAMSTFVNEDYIQFESRATKQKQHTPSTTRKTVAKSVGLSIDLHGMRFVEAMDYLDKYIDDALLRGYEKVTINHGLGTGILKNGVQDYLKKSKYVKSYRSGVHGEGGLGVTIVEFK